MTTDHPNKTTTVPAGTQTILKRHIVVSAVNLIEGGTLTVLRECLHAAASLPPEWEITALVHRANLINEPRIKLISIPSAKRSWMHRLYWEWWGFQRFARQFEPSLWLSLHDMTPRVSVRRQAVYCHNPAPFYRASLREALHEPTFLAHNLLYSALYRIFIRRNHTVIVQQDWLRGEFRRRMGALPLTVAHPVKTEPSAVVTPHNPSSSFIFFYPALPRPFKNLETLLAATRLLSTRTTQPFEVRVTSSGQENRYAKWLSKRFSDIKQVRFIGRQTSAQMVDRYRQASAVVFPSKLETWGLPISEAKGYGLPLLLADLPYAHEAVGNYDAVSFFPPLSPHTLADSMQAMMDGSWQATGNRQHPPSAPFAANWETLWQQLTSGLHAELSEEPVSATHAHLDEKMDRTYLADFIVSKLHDRSDELRAQWLANPKVGHFVIDDILPIKIANQIRAAFPPGNTMKIKRSLRELKFVAAQMNEYNPLLEEAVYAFQDPRVVAAVAEITQLKELEPDEMLYAGGISMMVEGHFLNPHIDNSHDKTRERYRVLNLLYYVSPDWKLENGGNLELWPNGPKGEQVTIESKFNRLVVMVTHTKSWHSVSAVKVPQPRCCVSNYYFSKQSPESKGYSHVTSFRGRPEQKLRDLVLRADIALRTGLRKLFPSGVVDNKHYYDKK